MMQDDNGSPRFFWSASDKDFIVEKCFLHWGDEVQELIHRADLACENSFIFTHRWDMERCEFPVTFQSKIDWTYRYNDDFEWTVNLNRARFMAELGQAYWLTNDEKYVSAYIRLMNDWLEQNPLSEEEILASRERGYNVKDTWRKLDSGIRISHWIKGYYCIKESPLWGAEEETFFRQALALHGSYLHNAYTPHDKQSNWGFLETNGLFQIALLFPGVDESEQWMNSALDRLEEMVFLQVFEDGVHNEQSPMYHLEVLHCLFEPVLLTEMNQLEYPIILRETLDRMYTASMAFIKPDGRQPMLSDSDDTDIRDVMSRGAVLCNRGDLKSRGYEQLDFEGIWYFGRKGFEQYDTLQAGEPTFCSVTLEQSGYAIMRDNWSKEGHYLLFDAGHMDVIRAHGHDDALHFHLSCYGADFLTDTGRYTYMENEQRRYFKESLQHNTVSVDGKTISEYTDSWNWGRVAKPVYPFWRTHEHFDYVQAGHDGYWRLEEPVYVLRQILFVKPDYWLVVDTLRSKGQHEYAQHFHFAEDVVVKINQNNGVVHGERSNGTGLQMVPIIPVAAQIKDCDISRNYNQKEKSSKIIYTKTGQGLTRFVTVLIPQHDLGRNNWKIREIDVFDTYDRKIDPEEAIALEIQRFNKTELVLFSHQGPRGYQFSGCQMCGEVLLVKRQENTEQKWVVKV